MKKPHAPEVRDFLRTRPDGATVTEICKESPRILSEGSARKVLENMPDAYIDRWVTPIRGQWQAIWCVVVPPRHCPYPTDRFTPETRWVQARV